MTRQRKTKRRTHASSSVSHTAVKPDIPSLSITYKDVNDSVKTTIEKIKVYQSCLSYKENFEDEVSTILEDGGVLIDGEYVIPTHRVLRYDPVVYEEPVAIKKDTPKKTIVKTQAKNTATNITESKDIKDGKICKGAVNASPSTPSPELPHCHGGTKLKS